MKHLHKFILFEEKGIKLKRNISQFSNEIDDLYHNVISKSKNAEFKEVVNLVTRGMTVYKAIDKVTNSKVNRAIFNSKLTPDEKTVLYHLSNIGYDPASGRNRVNINSDDSDVKFNNELPDTIKLIQVDDLKKTDFIYPDETKKSKDGNIIIPTLPEYVKNPLIVEFDGVKFTDIIDDKIIKYATKRKYDSIIVRCTDIKHKTPVKRSTSAWSLIDYVVNGALLDYKKIGGDTYVKKI